MKTLIKIKTWKCSECDYYQDFEPTTENMDKNFNDPNQRLRKDILVVANECPSCVTKGIRNTTLAKESNPNKKITLTIMGEEDIEPEIIKDDEEKTKEGKPKMTNPQKEAYRTKRKADIVSAISEARKLEDK